ncbi:MAG: TetR/AcrR family transcriptional regulator [Bacteroidales bacterium]|nr:TetR/AcrR family transcriptional regulator [Bacteroidales bacterium]MCF8345348.1 TetR/AcrR family transcriptional regulator [Bacteroidales bacterium]MCF8375729.1 TetR/AcrR family transcriptional regulator [Bacteroidales bacterium]MCF8400329.1 TetR/AcrR family transcriptional regulator [Bacteroidales bacterium]
MSPRTKKQFDDIRENRKKLIRDTALRLFAEEGYHVTSISKITEKADISKGLMYNYFSSKEELLMDILNEGVAEFINYFDTNKDGELTDDEFKYFLEMTFKVLKERTDYWRLYFSLALQPSVFSILQNKYRKLFETTLAIMEDYFSKRDYENPRMQALMFGAFLDGVGLNYVMDPRNFQIDEIKEYVIHHYLKL